jgi:hypothetical protein
MKIFAKVNKSNKVEDLILLSEEKAAISNSFIAEQLKLKGIWIEANSKTAIGFTYDKSRSAFIPPQPFASWVLDEESLDWVSPIPYPDDEKFYIWNESLISWESSNE